MAHQPPVYQTASPPAPSVTSLPAYTRRSRPQTARRDTTEHVFDLRNKHNKPWATMTIMSSARGPEHLPTYLEGDRIKGSFKLDLDHPDAILSITVTVTGQIITGNRPEDTLTFLDIPLTLWSKDGTENDLPSSPPSPRHNGKLYGEYTWPILFTLPKEVMVSPSGSRSGTGSGGSSGSSLRSYQMPQTFVERHTPASVQYNLLAHISRSKFRVDSKIKTQFIYVPAIQPGPPSMLRQLAYQENSPLLGPEADPHGWKTLPPVKIRGRIFSAREVELKVALSLAAPLSYTRGSAIPCHLDITCPDSQALDLLSTSRAITVCLRRRVKPSESYAQAEHNNWHSIRLSSDEDVATAVWWPSTEGDKHTSCTSTRRILDGEIKLLKGLKPSCTIAHFSVTYSVLLLPFRATAFSPSKPGPAIEQPVEVATVFASGPRARSYAPPDYDENRPTSSRPSTGVASAASAIPWALSN